MHLVERLGEAHAALVAGRGLLELALAAAAGMDLRLHHQHRAGQLLRRLAGLAHREGGHARPECGTPYWSQQFLGLILVDVHADARYPVGRGVESPALGAELRGDLGAGVDQPFTDSTDLMNMSRSAALRSISTIRSTPPAPITTGTPT